MNPTCDRSFLRALRRTALLLVAAAAAVAVVFLFAGEGEFLEGAAAFDRSRQS